MAGNVAEWTVEKGATFVARGGSYRSDVAGELKTWSKEAAKTPKPYIGFRCAYDAEPNESTADE